MNPPLLARALLLVVAGPVQAECVAGDLEEEFPLICERRGRSAGARWYAWQVLRSVPSLLDLRIRSGEFTGMVLSAGLGVAFPLLLLDRLWSFVYSQIPLKDGLDRAPTFLIVNVLVVCALAAADGSRTTSWRSAMCGALVITLATGLAVWLSVGSAPLVYAAAILLCAPASSIVGFTWRGAVPRS